MTKICGHCGGLLLGWAMMNDTYLCHPDVGMDCYRLVTVYREPIGARLPDGELHGKPRPIPDNPIPWEGFRRQFLDEFVDGP